MPRTLTVVQSAFFVITLLLAGSAAARTIPCEAAERGVISVDGLLDDWGDVRPLELGGDKDFAVAVRCNYDDTAVFLSVDVTDDYLAVSKAHPPGEDHVEVAVADGEKVDRLMVFPGDGDIKRKVAWSSGHAPKGVQVAESRQPRGWSVEIGIPLRSLPEYGPGVPLLHLGVAVADCDSKTVPKTERTLGTSPVDTVAGLSTLEFASARAAYEGFLSSVKAGPRDVSFDAIGNVTPTGKGRVVVAGTTLGILTDEYAYIGLPVRAKADIKEVRLADLAGDSKDAVLVRYVERGGGGSREVLAAYRLAGEGLRRVFGVEVGKAAGERKLATKVSLLPVKKGRGMEILVEALPAVGWTEQSYQEVPSEDLVSIPLPWSPAKKARFQFKGDTYFRVD